MSASVGDIPQQRGRFDHLRGAYRAYKARPNTVPALTDPNRNPVTRHFDLCPRPTRQGWPAGWTKRGAERHADDAARVRAVLASLHVERRGFSELEVELAEARRQLAIATDLAEARATVVRLESELLERRDYSTATTEALDMRAAVES